MKSTASFERRLNKDSDLRKLERGQYRSAKNARVGTSQESNVGTLESTASNLLFTGSYSFPSGTNKCIGACADIKNNAIIYCWFNSNNNHRIFRWDADTGVITNILSTSWNVAALGWTASTRLWNMRIVESGTDQLMFFHAVQGVPMRINLGIITQRGAGAYTLTIDDISVARKPPTFSPTLAYAIDVNSASSFIVNKFFQFRYRYVYENGEQSSWSPWSLLSVPPQNGVSYNKIVVTFNSGVKGVNKVEIARREGNGVSDTGTTNPTLYIFNTWIKGVNSDDTNYTVDFFNTEVLTPVSVASSSKLFDSVPQVVGCQEIVQSNQVIYGDITEGYDNLASTNVVINQTFQQTGIGEFTYIENSGFYEIIVGDWSIPPIDSMLYVQINEKIVSFLVTTSTNAAIGSAIADLIVLSGYTASYALGFVATNIPYTIFARCYWMPVNGSTSTEVASYRKTNASQFISAGYHKISWNEVLKSGVEKVNLTDFKLYENFIGGSASIFFNLTFIFVGSSTFNILLLDVTGTPTPIIYKTYSVLSPITQSISELWTIDGSYMQGRTFAIAVEKTSGANFDTIGSSHVLKITLNKGSDFVSKGFKSGSKHSFGLIYYDQYMRQCGVQAISSKYINFPTQRIYKEYYNTAFDSDGYIPQLNWEIKHLPPSWAYYYAWVYNGGDVQNFAQVGCFITDVFADTTAMKIKVSPDNFGLYKYIYSSFSAGDRIRILAGPVAWGDNLTDTTLCDMQDSYIEGIIDGFSLTEIIISTQLSNINVNVLDRFLIEFYAITKSELFFEQTIYEIGNPTLSNRFHKAPNQNQNPSNPISTPAKGDFIGNTYFRILGNYINKNLKVILFLTESNSITYEVESNFWNKGRPQVETPDQKQVRYNSGYRWGNQLIQNTQVNGMSTFDSGNIGILSAKFGALTAMREIGYTLKMIQESNYNTAFIGRKQLSNADGSTNLVVTDSLIGTVNPSEDLYGSKYPGSVVINGRNLYWLDTIKGKVIRESGNQPFPISDYGMVKYWRDASLQIDGLGYEVFAGFDKQTEQLFITYKRTGADVFTLSFYDPERDGIEKGWVCDEHSFTKVISSVITPVDMYAWVGQVFTSALGAGAYKHNVGNTYLQLYGEQKTMSVSSPFILNPEQMTVFLAHWVRANRDFLGTIFTIPAGPQTPNGMRTLLVSGNYSIKENAFYSEIKRDGLTKGLVSDDSNSFKIQMLEGRVMRGYVCLAEISYSGSLSFVIFSHSIADEYSPLS